MTVSTYSAKHENLASARDDLDVMVLRYHPDGEPSISNRKTGQDSLTAPENIALGKDDTVEAWWDGPTEDDRSGPEGGAA